MIVVDASSAIELLLNTAAGIRISARLLSSGETLNAPHLIDLEVAQVLRRYARSGEPDAGRGAQAVEDLADLAINRCSARRFSSPDLGASPQRDGL